MYFLCLKTNVIKTRDVQLCLTDSIDRIKNIDI